MCAVRINYTLCMVVVVGQISAYTNEGVCPSHSPKHQYSVEIASAVRFFHLSLKHPSGQGVESSHAERAGLQCSSINRNVSGRTPTAVFALATPKAPLIGVGDGNYNFIYIAIFFLLFRHTL
jgi:hypothetical protein